MYQKQLFLLQIYGGDVYMELDAKLLKQFSSIVNANNSNKSSETTAYATVVKNGDAIYVKIDGTDTLTPVSMAMDAEDGERVIVTIKNHSAIITGNISSPASARTATKFMQFTDDGLKIGNLDDSGKTTGTHTLIGSDSYYIMDQNGNMVAMFSGDKINLGNGKAIISLDSISFGDGKATFASDHAEIANGSAYLSPNLLKLGNSDSSEIQLCNGKGKIKMDGDVLILDGSKAIGLRNIYGLYQAEVVCRADSTNPVAALQAYKSDGSVSSVIVDMNGVRVTVPSNKKMYINGREVIVSNTIMCVGTVSGIGPVKSGKTVSISATVTVPSGYSLAGIREIRTNHNNICRMTQFYTNPSTNTVGASFVNTSGSDLKRTSSSDTRLKVTIEWFALRCSAPTSGGSTTVEWTDD